MPGRKRCGMSTRVTWIASGFALLLAANALRGQAGEAIEVGAAAKTANVTAATKRALRHGVFRFQSYGAAWKAAQKSNKPILVFASAPSCPHCVRMIGESYRSPQVS